MRKQILTLAAIVLSISVKSQVTVTSSNIVSVGDLIIQAGDTLIAITPTAAGPSQTWNFSSLAQHTVDTLTAIDPSTTANGANFPSSNIALEANDGSIIYADKNSSAFEFVGATIFGVPAEQYDKVIEFPATYGTTFTSQRSTYAKASGSDVGQPSADSVEYISKGTKTATFDAWGSLSTPLGTYSVIRQSNEIINNDTVNVMYGGTWIYGIQTGTDTTYEHQYWTDDASIKFPVVTYQLNDQGNYANKSITWLKVFSFASVDELENKKLSVYPNPTSDLININFEEDITSIEVLDITGKKVMDITNKNRNSINVSGLDNGTYILSVKSNNSVYTSSFIKK